MLRTANLEKQEKINSRLRQARIQENCRRTANGQEVPVQNASTRARPGSTEKREKERMVGDVEASLGKKRSCLQITGARAGVITCGRDPWGQLALSRRSLENIRKPRYLHYDS